VGGVIGDLPEPPGDYKDHPDFPNHQAARVTQQNIERFSYVPEGGGWQDIPFDLRLPCHQKVDTSRGGWPDVYGRLRWDGQCPTITGGFDSFTRGRYGHPRSDRPLTPREAARLQSFPDSHVFLGTRHDIRHQIGNAVPPKLAEQIGAQVIRALSGTTPRRHSAAPMSLF
jgi:DNA (cytosine-5)-methyltransferase 1